MATNRDSLNRPDWRDVATAWSFIEQTHNQPIRATLTRFGSGKFATIDVTMEMAEEQLENGAVRPSAYVKHRFSTNDVGGIEGALLSLLYRLDFQRSELPSMMIPDGA